MAQLIKKQSTSKQVSEWLNGLAASLQGNYLNTDVDSVVRIDRINGKVSASFDFGGMVMNVKISQAL